MAVKAAQAQAEEDREVKAAQVKAGRAGESWIPICVLFSLRKAW
jgi:hypothetical protein